MGALPKVEPTEATSYFHSMAGELARMARDQGLPVLAHIFDMAEHEAAGLGDGRAAEIIRTRRGSSDY
jgi:hypothetical protein